MESQKKQMMKRQFRIGDLAKELKVKKFVIRFWEKEFDLKSDRSQGGQRFYTDEDLDVFLTIKDLLYNQGFTIAGAKKQLPEALSGAKRLTNDEFDENNLTEAKSVEEINLDENVFDEKDDCSLEDSMNNIEKSFCEAEVSLSNKECKDFLEEKNSKKLNTVIYEQDLLSIHEEPIAVLSLESTPLLTDSKILKNDYKEETCIPARIAPDSSFYQELATLKIQLTRLYELLN